MIEADENAGRALLGVLGGMGPAATLDFLAKIQAATAARTDQEHWPVLTLSAAEVPDRTAAILGRGKSPLAAMSAGLRLLEAAGAACAAIPCNTAHYWFNDLQSATQMPLVHIVDAVWNEVARREIDGPIALLATSGTISSGVYQRRGHPERRRLRLPTAQQPEVTSLIDAVKAGAAESVRPQFARLVSDLIEDGCAAVILGCTELPILASNLPAPVQARCIDATDALARASLARVRAITATKRGCA